MAISSNVRQLESDKFVESTSTANQAGIAVVNPDGTSLIGVTPRDHSNINTSALATSLVVKASAGKCFDIRGYNSLASAQFIQVHDASSLPADTAVPEEVITVPASSNFSITFPEGKSFETGIVVCNSSTAATKTIGAADLWISADFE